MTSVLIVGCGDLGGKVAQLLQAKGVAVIGVRASDRPLEGISILQADVTELNSLKIIEGLNPNIIIYCVAANGQNDETYRIHYVEGLKNVLATQSNNKALQHVFFVSSTRVYGQESDLLLDETTPAMPCDFGGVRLLEAESLLDQLPCKSTKLRLSGIYGLGRLYLLNMARDPSRWPATNGWSNRIHRDDAARFIVFLCEKVIQNEPVDNCYIVTDDMPTQQYEVLNWLALVQGLQFNIPAPSVQSGKKLSNSRMRGTGFLLKYPNYQVGYRHIMQYV